VNEDLIYCSISGYGQTGPYARRPAYDAVMQTQTGFPVMQGGDGPPEMVNNFVCDKITGYQMVIAVLAALAAKSTGKAGGQNIEVSMLDSALCFFWSDAMGNTGASYATEDGFAAMMIWPFAPHYDKVIAAFQITEPMFQDNKSKEGLAAVSANWRVFFEILEARFGSMTNAEIDQLAAEHELPLGVVVDIDEFQHHPQIQHMGSIVTHEVGKLGLLREPRPAPIMSATPFVMGGASPQRGEHTLEILAEYGYTAEQRGALRETGVFGEYADE
jgi:crotonobetainyl-CoA:carnitine CoA-transferase CaiB-like acyl-CoA transferase